ncbi:MAG: DUF4296 domain-containing protein [Muribaculaceae bacterium]|nr:DUF4296 domain-containing protein [Muribaculaceae bacterium]
MSHLRLLPSAISLTMLLCLVCGCSDTPKGIIGIDKMAHLLADVYVGEATIESNGQQFSTDSARRALKQTIFKKHGVDIAQVDTSLYWYGQHVDKYMKVCEQTEEILQARIADAEKRGATSGVKASNLDGDSVNLWNGPSMRRITPGAPSDFITFSISRDRNWERGDRFTLSSHGVLTRTPATMMIAVDYSDGTSEYISSNHRIDELTGHLTLTLDSTKTGSTVYGYIRYVPQEGEVSYIDSISLVRTRGMNNNKQARQNQHSARFR